MRKTVILTAAMVAGLLGALAGPASAGTTTTFTLTGNASGLAVSVPDSASDIGSASTGASSVSGSLGEVTVTDPRGSLVSTWITTVSSTDFLNQTTGGTTANETVAKGNVSYSSGVGTAGTGQVGAMVPSVGVTLGSAKTAATWAGVGNNTVAWTPSLTFTLLASQVAGTYQGTITHSVA